MSLGNQSGIKGVAMSVIWYRDMYIGEQMQKHQSEVRRKLRLGIGTVRAFLIMMPSNPDNSLDIINAAYLKQPYYRKRKNRVVGMAYSYEEALQVVQTIVEEVYRETRGMDIKQYICAKQGNWQV